MRGSRSRIVLPLLLALAAVAPSSADDVRRIPAVPRFGLAYWHTMPAEMAVPVFDAASVAIGEQLVVLGGATESMTATPAIQVRSPNYGWQPVGSNLLESRARASITPLGGDRYLVLGGWSGTWGVDATQRADGEILAPLVAGSSKPVAPWPEPLEGHTATRMPDGRIAVVCGCRLRIFDPRLEAWTAEIELERERRFHAATAIGWNLVLVGGDLEGTIESVWLGSGDAHGELWDARLTSRLDESSAIAINERFAFVVGGFDPDTNRTTADTLILDTARRTLRPGPPLADARGACDVALSMHPRGVIALCGEWRDHTARGASETALLFRPLAPRHEMRRWSLPPLPSIGGFARRMAVPRPDGTVELLGGYRFVADGDALPDGRSGIVLDDSNQRLVVDVAGTAD
ncbi:MAG: hypothetical protein JNM94_16990 [Phycisphaerae bacterium]|nr:hypothetical protein [Phycisphaerae bacterium]